MIHENEVVMLVLGLCVLHLWFKNYRKFKAVPAWGYLSLAFFILMLAAVMTVLEGYFLEELFNYIEHICYAVSSILLAIWCWQACIAKENAR